MRALTAFAVAVLFALAAVPAVAAPGDWFPPTEQICPYSQVPPKWVCTEDPWCWCTWACDYKNSCYYLSALICAHPGPQPFTGDASPGGDGMWCFNQGGSSSKG
jgi:hypothetical protein